MNKAITSLAVILAAGADRSPAIHPLRRLGARTLLAHTILAARQARSVAEVLVVTPDERVAQTAVELGATALRLNGDERPVNAAADHLRRHHAGDEIIVLMDTRWPLVMAADVDGIVQTMAADDADSAVAVVAAPHDPLWFSGAGGATRAPGHGQDASAAGGGAGESPRPAYRETGALYAGRLGRVVAAADLVFGTTTLHVIPEQHAVSVNQPLGLQVAKTVMAERARSDRLCRLPTRPAGLVMDFDGVFTDNRVLVDETGKEAVMCNRSDGLGLEQLRALGLPMLVLSKERNPVVQARCRKLRLECLQGVDDKRPALEQWCGQHGLPLADVVYIGNDTNDLPCFTAVGCAVAVADAHDEALSAADLILANPGGRGGLRELTEMLAVRLGPAER